MKDYHINLFWSDEDDCYVADIPDLFPCSAFGDTPQEALAEVLIAKELWLETAREVGSRSPKRSTGLLRRQCSQPKPPTDTLPMAAGEACEPLPTASTGQENRLRDLGIHSGALGKPSRRSG